MKRTVLYTLPLFFLLANSCKKNALPPEEPSPAPVFYVKCAVNGNERNFEAGKDDYYMSSSYFQDANNVYVYKGELKQRSCAGCDYGITVLINDSRVSQTNAPMLPDSGLIMGKHEFNDGNLPPLAYQGTFANTLPSSVQYIFSAGSQTFENAPAAVLFSPGTTASVSLSVHDLSSGNTTTHTNVFKVDNPLQVNISTVKPLPTVFRFSATASKTIKSYDWDFGDGSQHSQEASPPQHSYDPQGYYTAVLRLISTDDDTCVSYYQAAAYSNKPHANFTNTFVPVLNTKALSAIVIQVTDPTGKVYSSENLDQPSTSNFEILSVENYKANESGSSTKKLKIRFNCIVKNGSESLNITGGEAVIAVAFK
jgi:hypothetical protein